MNNISENSLYFSSYLSLRLVYFVLNLPSTLYFEFVFNDWRISVLLKSRDLDLKIDFLCSFLFKSCCIQIQKTLYTVAKYISSRLKKLTQYLLKTLRFIQDWGKVLRKIDNIIKNDANFFDVSEVRTKSKLTVCVGWHMQCISIKDRLWI